MPRSVAFPPLSMPNAYSLVKPVLKFALEFYFRDIQTLGSESIPDEGPVIIASNHPSSLMDTVIIGTQTKRRIHYLARSGLFSSKLKSFLMRNVGAIPIYRPEDSRDASVDSLTVTRIISTGYPVLNPRPMIYGPQEVEERALAESPTTEERKALAEVKEDPSNDRTFEAVFELLEDGGCVGIFPEGRNSPDGRVLTIRTGAARMALGAEARNDFTLGLRIVPVGIFFDRRDRFMTTVLLRVGEPIRPADYEDLYKRDPREAVANLTADLQHAMRDEALHIREERAAELINHLNDIIGERLIEELRGRLRVEKRSLRKRFFDQLRASPEPLPNLDSTYQVRQWIADVVSDLAENDPERYDQLAQRVTTYLDHVEQVRIRHDLVTDGTIRRGSTRADAIRLTTYAIAFGPLAAWGWLNNIIPWLVTRRAALTVRKDDAMQAAALFGTGLIAFPLFYFIQGWVLWYYQQAALKWVILYICTLPLAGFSWLRYKRQVRRYRDRILARLLFRSNRQLVDSLTAERSRLVEFFGTLGRRQSDRFSESGVVSN